MNFEHSFQADLAYLDVPGKDGLILDSWGMFTADFPIPVVHDSSGTIVGEVYAFTQGFENGLQVLSAHGMATMSIALVLNDGSFKLAFDLLDYQAEILDGGMVFRGGRIVATRLIKEQDWNWA